MSTSRPLRERLADLPSRRRSHDCWRATRVDRDPLGTTGARLNGGRWNPPGLAVLYASLEPETVRAEFVQNAERRGVPESGIYPLRLARLRVHAKTVDLTRPDRLEALGMDAPVLTLAAVRNTQRIGRAAAAAGIEALLVPSAAAPGRNLVILSEGMATAPKLVETLVVRSRTGWP